MHWWSILASLAAASSLASARQCIAPTTSTGLAGSPTPTPTPNIASTSTDTATPTSTPASPSLFPLPALFYLYGAGSGNSNADLNPLFTGQEGYDLQFNPQDSGYSKQPFSTDSNGRLLVGGYNVITNSFDWEVYIASSSILDGTHPVAAIICNWMDQHNYILCAPDGSPSSTQFYVTTGVSGLYMKILAPNTSDAGFSAISLQVQSS